MLTWRLIVSWLMTLDAAAAQFWDGYHNRLVPEQSPMTRQNFGYHEGKIGGWIQRSTTPAWYAKVIEDVSLRQRLTAGGKFSVKQSQGGSGVLFGWFNTQSRGWRLPNSLVV